MDQAADMTAGCKAPAGIQRGSATMAMSQSDMAGDGAMMERKQEELDIEKFPLAAKLLAARIKEEGWTIIGGHTYHSNNWSMRFRHPTNDRTVLEITFNPRDVDLNGHHFSACVSSVAGADSVEQLQKAIQKFTDLKF
jgi:hypothetical protein